MRGLIEAAARMGAARAAELGEALVQAARDELPAGLDAEAAEGGVRIAGRGLARRLAFEAPLARLIAGQKREARQ